MSRRALRVVESCFQQTRRPSPHHGFAQAASISTRTAGQGNLLPAQAARIPSRSSWTPRSSSSHPTFSASNLLASYSRRWNSSTSSAASLQSSSSSSPEEAQASKEPRLSLTFTCTAPIPVPADADAGDSASAAAATPETQKCDHRSSHTFTKRAYEKGIVIIACPSCKNRHLIADNLGWFKNQDGSEGGRTVEDFVKANGETVKRGALVQTPEGDVEFAP